MPLKIDAHHHFWRYDPVEYGWIDDQMSSIRRDFLPQELENQIRRAGVTGVVSVQARQTLEETRWLLQLTDNHKFVLGVVGWVPLTSRNLQTGLEELTTNKKLCAIRHVLQDEPDPLYILRDDFNRGIRTLKSFGLVYDILIYERHLPQTIQFVDKHPTQVFVIDHLAKPRVKDNQLHPWRENIHELAKRPNVYCKISGLATEGDYSSWTVEQLEPYLDTVLNSFTPHRLMFGSDWPVCLVAVQYERWVEIVSEAIRDLSETEQERIWSGTAQEAYRLVI
jgi:L-fuconolactonase